MMWHKTEDESGTPYYWNEAGDVQYDKPEEYEEERATSQRAYGQRERKQDMISPWVGDEVGAVDGYHSLTYGRISFPASKCPPSKWVKVPNNVSKGDMQQLVTLLCKSWKLPTPSVIISVTGGARNFDLNDKQRMVFRRGLMKAAQVVCGSKSDDNPVVPWIITGGVKSGVMELVGKSMQHKEAGMPDMPCIGITPWGITAQRDHMLEATRSIGNSHKGMQSSARRWGAKYEFGSKSESAADEHQRNPLDPNHTHFVLVDDGQSVGVAAYGKEIDVRVNLEDMICDTVFGVDKDGDALPKPAMMLLVVGGGPNTFLTMLETLKKERPVVCLPDSGGAAKAVFQYVRHGGIDAVDVFKPGSDAHAAAMLYLPQIKIYGERPVGANQEAQLQFFSTDMDVAASNDLSTIILSAILSDCQTTSDAINLAVRWRDPEIIRNQLDESQDADPRGLTKALQNALLGRDPDVVKCLIDYQVRPQHLSMTKLMEEIADDAQGVSYVWSSGFEWMSVHAKFAIRSSHAVHPKGATYDAGTEALLSRLPAFMQHWFELYLARAPRWREQEVTDLSLRGISPEAGHAKTDWLAVMLWAVLAEEVEIAKAVWTRTLEPMRFAIWAAHLANFVSKTPAFTAVKRQEWKDAAETYESWAVGLLDEANDSETAVQQLTFASDRFGFQSAVDQAIEKDPDARACRKFIGHPHCQDLALRYFRGDYPGSGAVVRTSGLFTILCHTAFLGIFPIVTVQHVQPCPDFKDAIDVDEDDDDEEEEVDATVVAAHSLDRSVTRSTLFHQQAKVRTLGPTERFIAFLNVPCTKFVTHNLLALVYLLLLALGLCGLPWHGSSWMTQSGFMETDTVPAWEWLFWGWSVLRIVEEAEQFLQTRDKMDYFTDVYNLMDVSVYVLIAGVIVVRILFAFAPSVIERIDFFDVQIVRYSAQFAYASVLLMLCARTINAFKINRRVGVLIIMLGKMIPQIKDWILLTMCITVGFSLFFTVTIPGAIREYDATWPFWQPFWGLLGAFELDDIETYAPLKSADPTTILAPVFMWLYAFISTVVLVNLLIAQMSSVYEKVEENAEEYWNFAFMESTVREYKDQRKTPAPLNFLRLFTYLYGLVRRGRGDPGVVLEAHPLGFHWLGGSNNEDVARAKKQHRRLQSEYCRRYTDSLRKLEAESLHSQVSVIKERQTDFEEKQEQRLESLLSKLETIEQLIGHRKASKTSRTAPTQQPTQQPTKLAPMPGASTWSKTARLPLVAPALRPKQLVLPALRSDIGSVVATPVETTVKAAVSDTEQASAAPEAAEQGTLLPDQPVDPDTQAPPNVITAQEAQAHIADGAPGGVPSISEDTTEPATPSTPPKQPRDFIASSGAPQVATLSDSALDTAVIEQAPTVAAADSVPAVLGPPSDAPAAAGDASGTLRDATVAGEDKSAPATAEASAGGASEGAMS